MIFIFLSKSSQHGDDDDGDDDGDDDDEVTKDFYDYKTKEPYIPAKWMENTCYNVTCQLMNSSGSFESLACDGKCEIYNNFTPLRK